MQEAAYEVKNKVDEVVGKFIKKIKSYNIYFQIGFSYHMNRWISIGIKSVLTYHITTYWRIK